MSTAQVSRTVENLSISSAIFQRAKKLRPPICFETPCYTNETDDLIIPPYKQVMNLLHDIPLNFKQKTSEANLIRY